MTRLVQKTNKCNSASKNSERSETLAKGQPPKIPKKGGSRKSQKKEQANEYPASPVKSEVESHSTSSSEAGSVEAGAAEGGVSRQKIVEKNRKPLPLTPTGLHRKI